MDLFDKDIEIIKKKMTPLADRIRPSVLKDFVGQQHLIGEGKPLRKLIERDSIGSIIFWGPPGSGKTTLARLIANTTKRKFEEISAVNAGVADLRRVINIAQRELQTKKIRTILFIDEVHRFNKAQQDAVLPFVEKGIITMIGSTTENPSFEVIRNDDPDQSGGRGKNKRAGRRVCRAVDIGCAQQTPNRHKPSGEQPEKSDEPTTIRFVPGRDPPIAPHPERREHDAQDSQCDRPPCHCSTRKNPALSASFLSAPSPLDSPLGRPPTLGSNHSLKALQD